MSDESGPKEFEQTLQQIQRYMPPVVLAILFFLTLDSTVFHWLPFFIPEFRYLVIFIFIYAPSKAAYNLSHIPEFLIPLFTVIVMFILWIVSFAAKIYFSFAQASLQDSGAPLFVNLVFILVLGFWLWIGYRFSVSRVLKAALFVTYAIVYLIILDAYVFKSPYAGTIYNLGIAFLSAWLILIVSTIKPLYQSKRIKRAKTLVLVAFASLIIFSLVLVVLNNVKYDFLQIIGRDIWLYCIWLIMFLNSEALILTEPQTLEAIKGYYQMKTKEIDECVVLANLDVYVRNMPEEVLRLIDNEELTLIWIGLQRKSAL